MDVTFRTSKDGRPEIYDFVWEHVSPLYQSLGEKRIRIAIHPGWTNALSPIEWEHLIQKISHDKRFSHRIEKVNVGQRSVELTVASKNLDDFLNAYNILFDAVLPYLRFDSKQLHVDFSHAGEQSVLIHVHQKHAEKIRSFLSQRLTRPQIRTVRFGIPNSVHSILSRRAKK
jgi:hypothetical protein